MLNHEGSHHEHFEELCVLAASGQVSETEFVELQDHLQQCADCRSSYSEFTDLLHYKLPLAGPELNVSSKLSGFSSKTSSYRERFLARARKQGLTFSQPSSRDDRRHKLGIGLWAGFSYARAATVAMALLLLMVGVLGYRLHQSDGVINELTADIRTMQQRSIPQNELLPDPPEESHATAAPPDTPPDNRAAEKELARVRRDQGAAEERARVLEEQLQSVASQLATLRTQGEETSEARNRLEEKLKEAEQTAAGVKDELQKIRQDRFEDAATTAARDLEIRNLSDKLTEQTEMLERERTLLAAGRDIHDLMGARNLHIVDVLDVDSKGKDKRAFGRVFYTEEKSLIFYAFDLGDRGSAKRNASFQVWGARGPSQTPAQSLGIFFVDDQKQNRWVLKFEDPRILSEIDSVFVTVEPQGGSAKPTGSKFLYAYLKANPNHP
jgi:hypothetical protein